MVRYPTVLGRDDTLEKVSQKSIEKLKASDNRTTPEEKFAYKWKLPFRLALCFHGKTESESEQLRTMFEAWMRDVVKPAFEKRNGG